MCHGFARMRTRATDGNHVLQPRVIGADNRLLSDGTFNYDPTAVATINALGAGQSLVDTFTYVAQDAFGVLSNTATVTLNVQGVNDDISLMGTLVV